MKKTSPETIVALEDASTFMVLVMQAHEGGFLMHVDNRTADEVDVKGMMFPGCGELAMRFTGLQHALGGGESRGLDQLQVSSAWSTLTELAKLLRDAKEHCPSDLQAQIDQALEMH